jgi:hypothetical protein
MLRAVTPTAAAPGFRSGPPWPSRKHRIAPEHVAAELGACGGDRALLTAGSMW